MGQIEMGQILSYQCFRTMEYDNWEIIRLKRALGRQEASLVGKNGTIVKKIIPTSTPNRSSSSGVLEYLDLVISRTPMKGVNWKGNHRDTHADTPNR